MLDKDGNEIVRWITVKGNRIPIIKGQDPQDAINNFLKNVNKKKYKFKSFKVKVPLTDNEYTEMTKEDWENYQKEFGIDETVEEWEEEFDSMEEYIPKTDYLNQKAQTKYNVIPVEEQLNYLIGAGLDEEKLKNLSPQEIAELLVSYLNTQYDKKNLADKYKDELEKINLTYGIWKNLPPDYKSLKKSIKEKIEFYKMGIDLGSGGKFSPEEVLEIQQKLDVCEDIQENFLPKWAKTTRKDNRYNKLIEESKKLISNFEKLGDVYSQKAKDEAIWFKGTQNEVINKSISFFGPQFEEMWNKMSKVEKDKLVDYTGAFSKYNKPLRAYPHYGWKGWDFKGSVEALTSAIDKCTWKDNIWVQRGIDPNAEFLNGKSVYDIENSENGLESLVGTTFKEPGFYSAGAGKGTGFPSNMVILNTYCPKGTKMAYTNTKGKYSNGPENEMVLQRGYTYRITKAEYKSGKYYIDCEVILGSDSDKYQGEKLTKLGKEWLL